MNPNKSYGFGYTGFHIPLLGLKKLTSALLYKEVARLGQLTETWLAKTRSPKTYHSNISVTYKLFAEKHNELIVIKKQLALTK